MRLDPDNPLVTVMMMMGGTPDRIVGTTNLFMCRKAGWRNRVKICAELFSTATASERVADRNSVQGGNCSFGYFRFARVAEAPFTASTDSCLCKPSCKYSSTSDHPTRFNTTLPVYLPIYIYS